MDAEITYLHHSSFAVKTSGHFLIFDYYLDEPSGCGLAKGVIDPKEIKDENVVVFASHRHPDHFSSRIFSWRREIPKIRYVLADDIRTREPASFLSAGQTADVGGVAVRALKSTDLGVAFLVRTDGLCLYHAGDLNWWKWDGEPDADNEKMGRDYRRQIDTLKGEKIGLAFLPVDPRQGNDCLLGFDYFMRTVGAERAVPMHSFGRTKFYERLKSDPVTADYRDRILFYRNRGDRLSYTKNPG
ncbi:MAG: MBL fold metallo-hydrolase [Oscillospiraceae bacterium]|jgi:L-ascorbate metabolism protein UlaG (beta-lactamase superfamily)|nr:MBL fold metallo-hydrolase [Oscillospiraceae bacterium]MCI1990122.1 MBL fold metallo-hydrolase [Oscillospiraceae bacterium]MCI2034501.1 MBL fold metallo-hydrolase [Oscillospiraceae bacterium]